MIPYETFTLSNGLRVVHNYDPQSAMVALCILYDTGARDEKADHTGMAHLFEHLMFGGSVNEPHFDSRLELAGGTNNAATSNDFTIFYDVLPAQNAETAFYLESDRMLGLAFSDKALDVQRNVVIEEFKEVCLNRPYGRLMHELRPLIYTNHPYRWPVIGIEPDHIAKTTQDEVRHWFFNHYAPNNATMAIVGNITSGKAHELTQKWFGSIPSRQIEKRNLVDDPWPSTTQKKVIYDNVPQTLIAIAYRMEPYGSTQYFAADAITDILAAGKSARFFQRLVMGTDLFTMAEASISGSEHSGFVLLSAQTTREDEESINRAIEMLISQAKELAITGNVSNYELLRTQNRYESTFVFDNVGLVNRAQNLATALYHNEDINDNVKRYRQLTLLDIADAAQHIFIDHAPSIVLIRPQETKTSSI